MHYCASLANDGWRVGLHKVTRNRQKIGKKKNRFFSILFQIPSIKTPGPINKPLEALKAIENVQLLDRGRENPETPDNKKRERIVTRPIYI